MGNELLKKMNNNNYKIINELIEIIADENINTIDELRTYQNNLFKVNGKKLNHDEQIEYCIKLTRNTHIKENIDFVDIQKIGIIKEKLNNNNSNKGIMVLLIQLMSLLEENMLLPYDAYNLIMNNEL
ncbi:MAG: hypothetical protein IKX00_02550 [Bacilli bacterium]|nr:hypothetical protein [Bacilli bacterium]